MKSPFPGMDPYLEAHWSNVHVLMMGAITAALNRGLPAGLRAKPEEEVRVETLSGERLHGYRGDVAVIKSARREPVSSFGPAVAEPIRIAYRRGPLILRNIQIVDTANGERIVTVIEVLSPWNKLSGKLNRAYRKKMSDLETGGVNWVEIDLLRSSRDRLPVTLRDLPEAERKHYLVVAYRAQSDEIDCYPISIRECLPVVPIPLRVTDPDAPLDLQAVMDRVYDEGAFGSIDYRKPLEPPLSPDDAEWTSCLLIEKPKHPGV